jgi:site-specific recombinase XerD
LDKPLPDQYPAWLRVSGAAGAGIEALGVERGLRTLVITRKSGKAITTPLAPRTSRVIDLAIGETARGARLPGADGRRLGRHGAGRIVRRIAHQAGITKSPSASRLRQAFITRGTGCRSPSPVAENC